MSTLFTLIWLVSIPVCILGFLNPKWVFMPSRQRTAIVYGGIFVISFIGLVATAPKTSNSQLQSQGSPPPKTSARPSPLRSQILPAPQLAKIGDVVKIDDWELVVNKVEKLGSELAYTDFGNIQQASGNWLIVDITLHNKGKQPRKVEPFNFIIVDSSATEYEHYTNPVLASLYATKNQRVFLSNPIVPGGSIQSLLIFDVSPSASGFTLKFTPSGGKEKLINLSQ